MSALNAACYCCCMEEQKNQLHTPFLCVSSSLHNILLSSSLINYRMTDKGPLHPMLCSYHPLQLCVLNPNDLEISRGTHKKKQKTSDAKQSRLLKAPPLFISVAFVSNTVRQIFSNPIGSMVFQNTSIKATFRDSDTFTFSCSNK